MIAMLLAALAAPAFPAVPPEARPARVTTTLQAVAARDAQRIAGAFENIVEVTDEGSRTIAAGAAVEMLAGCTPGEVSVMYDKTYVVHYACPARRPAATGCYSGDLTLFIDGDRSSFALALDRKISDACRPFAPPPPPPPVDEAIAKRFAQALLRGDEAVIADLVGDSTFVGTEQRWPGTKRQETKGNGSGLAELRRQYRAITAEIGEPGAVACEPKPAFEFCRFTYPAGDKLLLAFLNTKGPGMYLVHFVYAVKP